MYIMTKAKREGKPGKTQEAMKARREAKNPKRRTAGGKGVIRAPEQRGHRQEPEQGANNQTETKGRRRANRPKQEEEKTTNQYRRKRSEKSKKRKK